jgi:hypothetical protein
MTHSNRVTALQRFGQSVWLDHLRRSLFTSGKFGRLIAEDGRRGVTSNPSIFEKAMVGTTKYEAALSAIDGGNRFAPVELYEALAIRDIQTREPSGAGGNRQCQARVPEVPGRLPGRPLAAVGCEGRSSATPAVGEYQHEEPALSRCSRCRGVDWPPHCNHTHAANNGGIP